MVLMVKPETDRFARTDAESARLLLERGGELAADGDHTGAAIAAFGAGVFLHVVITDEERDLRKQAEALLKRAGKALDRKWQQPARDDWPAYDDLQCHAAEERARGNWEVAYVLAEAAHVEAGEALLALPDRPSVDEERAAQAVIARSAAYAGPTRVRDQSAQLMAGIRQSAGEAEAHAERLAAMTQEQAQAIVDELVAKRNAHQRDEEYLQMSAIDHSRELMEARVIARGRDCCEAYQGGADWWGVKCSKPSAHLTAEQSEAIRAGYAAGETHIGLLASAHGATAAAAADLLEVS